MRIFAKPSEIAQNRLKCFWWYNIPLKAQKSYRVKGNGFVWLLFNPKSNHYALTHFSNQYSTAEREDYIEESDFYEGYSHLIDYCSEISEKEEEEALSYLPFILEGLCEVNGRELTVVDSTAFFREWRDYLVDIASHVFSDSSLWELENSCKRTHKDIWTLFYTSGWANIAEPFSAFAEYVSGLKPGTKLYVCGILDYHW